MTLLRAVFVALLIACLAAPGTAAEGQPVPAARAPSPAELLTAIGLDGVFIQFGRSIAASPRSHGVDDTRFLAAWEAGALEAFADRVLSEELEASLDGMLAEAERRDIQHFLASPLGQRLARLEQAAQAIPAQAQLSALAKGQTLYWALSASRKAQFEELLRLSGTELTFGILAESLRGMALGLHLAAGGDIEAPLEDIDAAVTASIAGMQDSLADAARATLAYTYAEVTDPELEAYLAFLRTAAARKLYGATNLAVSAIIRDTMFNLGQSVALRLRRVDI